MSQEEISDAIIAVAGNLTGQSVSDVLGVLGAVAGDVFGSVDKSDRLAMVQSWVQCILEDFPVVTSSPESLRAFWEAQGGYFDGDLAFMEIGDLMRFLGLLLAVHGRHG